MSENDQNKDEDLKQGEESAQPDQETETEQLADQTEVEEPVAEETAPEDGNEPEAEETEDAEEAEEAEEAEADEASEDDSETDADADNDSDSDKTAGVVPVKTKAKKPETKEEKKAAKEAAKRRRQRAKATRGNKAAANRRQKDREKKSKRAAFGNNRRNVWLLVLSALLVVVSIFMFTPPGEKINQGLDIQGGLSVVLSAQSTDGEEITAEDMESSRSIIESRVNALGASEATVQVQGDNQILVQIPGLDDAETALNTIGMTGSLVFARADSFTDEDTQTAIEYGTYASEDTYTDEYGNSFSSGTTSYMSVEEGAYTPLITGENIQSVSVSRESDTSSYYAVNITLDSEGTEAFAQATSELAEDNGQIVIILDGEIRSAPAVQSVISDGQVAITGDYTLEEAQALQTVLESGSLPVSFTYEQSQVVGPTLGQDALTSGLMVALIGLAIVILYLIIFYHGLGLLTAVAMIVFSVLYLGILATLSAFGLFSLSLAGIAGIVLTIGMAADSSILVLERFREEIRMGRSVRAASITGVRHAIETSIDADLVTLVSALTLFFLASASVKGFGMTLALGIICDIVMMLILKAPLIRLLAPKVIAQHPGFWGIKDSEAAAPVYADLQAESKGLPLPSEVAAEGDGDEEAKPAPRKTLADLKGRFIKRDINFMGVRKILLSISAVLIVASIGTVAIKGLEFGIEFVGGTSIQFHDTGDTTIDEIRAAFEDAGEDDAVIQTTTTDGSAGFLVRTATTSAEDAASVATTVANELGFSTDSYEVNTVGPDWGSSVIQASVIAFVVSLLLIIAYIAVRFEYKMGIMAIVALLHDLIIVVGIYALVGREVTPNTIAALLTILGYSLYDTVVVFHRINDNMKELDVKCTFMSMANHSVNQVFVRTINTTLTSLVPVLAMLFFGGETLKDFAFAMAIGLITGSYSSIAVATPLYALWKTREPANAKLLKKFGPEVRRFTFASTLLPAAAAAGSVAPEAGVETTQAAEKTSVKAGQSKQGKNNNKSKQDYTPVHYRRKKK